MRHELRTFIAVGVLTLAAPSLYAQEARRPKLVVTDSVRGVTILQPTAGLNDGTDDGSAAKGKDVWDGGCWPSGPQLGAYAICATNSNTCPECKAMSYVQFNLAGMPTTDIQKVEIQLFTRVWHWDCGTPYPADPVFGLRRVTSDWDEMTIPSNSQPTVDDTVIASQTFTGVAGQVILEERWVSYSITDLYTRWVSGEVPNYGVRISHDNQFCMNCDSAWFYSSDDGLTKLTYAGQTTGNAGDSASVSAILEDVGAYGSGVLQGRSVSFTVGTQSCVGTTNTNGLASCDLTPAGAGTQTIYVSFAGDAGAARYQPSSTTAQFEIIGGVVTYTIDATAGPNGNIAPSGSITVNAGQDQAFAMTPNAGYHVADVLVDGASVGAVGSYTFPAVAAGHTISASFAIDAPRMLFGGLKPPYAPPPATFKVGRAIPLKWQYTDARGVVVKSASASPAVYYSPAPCGATVGGAATRINVPGDSGLTYEAATGTWHINWKTTGVPAGCYLLLVTSPTAQTSPPIPIKLVK